MASEQHQLLSESAQKNGAQETEDNQGDVAFILQSQNKAIEGAVSKGNLFPELTKPHFVLASAAGIVTTTAEDTHVASGGHAAITTGKSLSLAAGTNIFASIRKTFRLFVQKAGMKMIAGAGDIDVQALSDSIKFLAKLEISHTANRITISAKEEIVINGGGSYARFTPGGIEHGTNGTFVAHAASHSLSTAKGMNVPEVSTRPLCTADHDVDDLEQYFSFEDENGKPISGISYRVDSMDQALAEGVLDVSGRTPGFPLDKEITHTSWISRR
jgi:type VI secretion system secreted protein VgrG